MSVDARADAGLQGVDVRPDHPRRHQRGRLGRGVHGGRHVVRDARRADDADLHLLLDVRLPAHRRQHLGGRRPDGPRLPDRRDRRSHHADRRGPAAQRRPLADLASTNPAIVAYDPAYGYEIGHIVKDGLRRMYGESPENVIYYLTVYNEPNVQPPQPEDLDVEGVAQGHVPAQPPEHGGPAGPAPRVRRRGAVGAGGAGAAWPATSALRPTSGASRRGTSCAETVSPATSRTSCTRRASSARRT